MGKGRMECLWILRLEPQHAKHLGPGTAVLLGKAKHRLGVGCEPATLGDRWMVTPHNRVHELDETTAHGLTVEAVGIGGVSRYLIEKILWAPPEGVRFLRR
jgi:hypothetical protein